MIDLECPNCGQIIGVSSQMVGKSVSCGKCKTEVHAPCHEGFAGDSSDSDGDGPESARPGTITPGPSKKGLDWGFAAGAAFGAIVAIFAESVTMGWLGSMIAGGDASGIPCFVPVFGFPILIAHTGLLVFFANEMRKARSGKVERRKAFRGLLLSLLAYAPPWVFFVAAIINA